MRTKRKAVRFPETWAQRAERLRGLNTQWRIEAPYYPRDPEKQKRNETETYHFPPLDVSPYTFDEAVEILRIFCGRYTCNGQLPPGEVEPTAFEVNPEPLDRDGQPRRLASFTFKDVDEQTSKWAEKPLPPSRALDEDDDAERWLREHAA